MLICHIRFCQKQWSYSLAAWSWSLMCIYEGWTNTLKPTVWQHPSLQRHRTPLSHLLRAVKECVSFLSFSPNDHFMGCLTLVISCFWVCTIVILGANGEKFILFYKLQDSYMVPEESLLSIIHYYLRLHGSHTLEVHVLFLSVFISVSIDPF